MLTQQCLANEIRLIDVLAGSASLPATAYFPARLRDVVPGRAGLSTSVQHPDQIKTTAGTNVCLLGPRLRSRSDLWAKGGDPSKRSVASHGFSPGIKYFPAKPGTLVALMGCGPGLVHAPSPGLARAEAPRRRSSLSSRFGRHPAQSRDGQAKPGTNRAAGPGKRLTVDQALNPLHQLGGGNVGIDLRRTKLFMT